MGCISSKSNEQVDEVISSETVNAAKLREDTLEEVMFAYKVLVTTHFEYAMALERFGTSLKKYAQGEINMKLIMEPPVDEEKLLRSTSYQGTIGGTLRDEGRGLEATERGDLNVAANVFENLHGYFLDAAKAVCEVAQKQGLPAHSSQSLGGLKMWTDAPPNSSSLQDELGSDLAEVLGHWLQAEKRFNRALKIYEDVKLDMMRRKILQKKLPDGNTLPESVASLYIKHKDSFPETSVVEHDVPASCNSLCKSLISLIRGMSMMWEAVQSQNELQLQTVRSLSSLGNFESDKATNNSHNLHTICLLEIVLTWESQFEKITTCYKDFANALKKLSDSCGCHESQLHDVLQALHDSLENIVQNPKEDLNRFATAVNNIVKDQERELALKLKCEHTRGDIAQAMMLVAPELSEQQKRLEEEYKKECILVREKSLASLVTRQKLLKCY